MYLNILTDVSFLVRDTLHIFVVFKNIYVNDSNRGLCNQRIIQTWVKVRTKVKLTIFQVIPFQFRPQCYCAKSLGIKLLLSENCVILASVFLIQYTHVFGIELKTVNRSSRLLLFQSKTLHDILAVSFMSTLFSIVPRSRKRSHPSLSPYLGTSKISSLDSLCKMFFTDFTEASMPKTQLA